MVRKGRAPPLPTAHAPWPPAGAPRPSRNEPQCPHLLTQKTWWNLSKPATCASSRPMHRSIEAKRLCHGRPPQPPRWELHAVLHAPCTSCQALQLKPPCPPARPSCAKLVYRRAAMCAPQTMSWERGTGAQHVRWGRLLWMARQDFNQRGEGYCTSNERGQATTRNSMQTASDGKYERGGACGSASVRQGGVQARRGQGQQAID